MKKRPPTSIIPGDESRRRREGVSTRRDAEIYSHGNFVGLVHRGHVATCEKKLFLAARSTAASFGGLSRCVRSVAGRLSQLLLIVHIGGCLASTNSLATRSRPRSFLRTPDRTQYFLLYCGTFPEAPFSEMVVELRDPVSRQTPNFLELRPPEASVETPAAREPAKLPPKNRAKPNTKS